MFLIGSLGSRKEKRVCGVEDSAAELSVSRRHPL